MIDEIREPHAETCECEHCVGDRRYGEVTRRHEDARDIATQGLELGRENNRLLSAILDELRALRADIKAQR